MCSNDDGIAILSCNDRALSSASNYKKPKLRRKRQFQTAVPFTPVLSSNVGAAQTMERPGMANGVASFYPA